MSVVAAKYDIMHYQGDTFTLAFYMTGDVTSQTPLMQLRTSPSSAVVSATPTITMTYNAGTGKTFVEATMTSVVTAAYYYDFQFTNAGVVTTYLYGNFTMTAEVSR
jgi:ABC-type transport system involved in Fe-S cluster assembly fused permease/ATPase subunit